MPVIVVITPLVISFLVFLSSWWTKRSVFPLVLAALTVSLVAASVLLKAVMAQGTIQYWLGGWPPPWGIEYRVDHFNAFMLILVAALALLAAIYGRGSVEAELPGRVELFWSLYLLLITGLLGIIVTGDMFNLFVLLEVVSLAGYALIAIGRGNATLASFRYLILGTIGACFYLIGVGYLYIMTGSLNMEDLRVLLPPLYGSTAIRAAFVFILIGFGIKIALFPLHAWQPDAYTHAPSAVSVIISTAMAKTLIYALIRIVFSVFTLDFITANLPVFDILRAMAAIAIVAGSLFAIYQNNFKRMLAYSSVANVGYIVLAIGLAPLTPFGLTPGLMHILNHAVIKMCMFMVAGAFIYKAGLVDIRQFEGLSRKMPYTSFGLILAILSMIGMPPSAGFVTKWYLILAALDAQKYLLVGVIFFSTLLMIIYFWRVVEIMYIRVDTQSSESLAPPVDEVPPSMLMPILATGVLTVVIGIIWITGVFDPLVSAINTSFGLEARP
ncbi:MAG: monovalent cation/H+ antiporter subunit D family protein [Deltaproteobacteria bacterium]|nr:monovalent cation/H+ antiporter subunit D family protein [Deltaproteobacteria bacterium]MBW2633195.1 monovalent cation/H+ antiporter subunit D family protein [Deltaproteobacteria bacterium]